MGERSRPVYIGRLKTFPKLSIQYHIELNDVKLFGLEIYFDTVYCDTHINIVNIYELKKKM